MRGPKWVEIPILPLDTLPQARAYKSNMPSLVYVASYEIPARLFVKTSES